MLNILLILSMALILISCSKQDSTNSESKKAVTITLPASQADFDIATVALGGKLYNKNCATCHGIKAEGNPDWRKRKPDGKLLPPPLNGSGHTWHHSKALLVSIISNGTVIQGGEMPAWGDKLSAQEIDAVILWAQSKWPEEIYKSWLEVTKR